MNVDIENLSSIQEAILKSLDVKHDSERDALIRMLNKIESSGFDLKAKTLSTEERNQRLTLLMQIWQKMFASATESSKAGEEQEAIFDGKLINLTSISFI